MTAILLELSQDQVSQNKATVDAGIPTRASALLFAGRAQAQSASRLMELTEPTDDLPSRRADALVALLCPGDTLAPSCSILFLHLSCIDYCANNVCVVRVHSLLIRSLLHVFQVKDTCPRSLTDLVFPQSLLPTRTSLLSPRVSIDLRLPIPVLSCRNPP